MRNLKRYNDLIRRLSALKTEKEVINVKIKEVEDEIKQIEDCEFNSGQTWHIQVVDYNERPIISYKSNSIYRISENINGFWVEEFITESKRKERKITFINYTLIFFGIIKPYFNESIESSKWVRSNIHKGQKAFTAQLNCFNPFKTLEEAKDYVNKLIKYQSPVIHEI